MGILETYGVSWTLEKAARDTWQNFFDSNARTLDGVDAEVAKEDSEYVIRIRNNATYDFRRLLHLGGTTKSKSDYSAGGIGEGAKILGLVLLRDYNFSKVKFASLDWSLEFLLKEIPKSTYVEPIKGLFAYVEKYNDAIEGNMIEFRTREKAYVDIFKKSKDLFYHLGNLDFYNPTLDIKDVGGFKFLGGNTSPKSFPKGNLYIAGQRRHFAAETWDNVEYVSIWLHRNRLSRKDRDRGLITRDELFEEIIPEIISNASQDKLVKAVREMEPIWTEPSGQKRKVGPILLEKIVNQLAEDGVKLEFDNKYLARSPLSLSLHIALSMQGYVLCADFMEKIGMKPSKEKFRELQKHYKTEISLKDEEKIKILYEAVKPLGRNPKEIWIFSRENEKSIFNGQYNENFVWLSLEVLHGSFSKALATYLHELDHKHGSDLSSEFSYALTDTLEDVIEYIIEKPDVYKELEKKWNSYLV